MMMVEQKRYESFLRLRQALAWPLYAVSVVLDFASVALGRLAAWTPDARLSRLPDRQRWPFL
jgi:hypothetical protein